MYCQPLTKFRGYRIEIYNPKNPKRYKLIPETKKFDCGACSVPNSINSELLKFRKLVQRLKPENLGMADTDQRRLAVRV